MYQPPQAVWDAATLGLRPLRSWHSFSSSGLKLEPPLGLWNPWVFFRDFLLFGLGTVSLVLFDATIQVAADFVSVFLPCDAMLLVRYLIAL